MEAVGEISPPNSNIPLFDSAELETPQASRRSLGQIYTPAGLVDFVLDRAIATEQNMPGPILDPACGGGAFLTALVRRLATNLTRRGAEIRDGDRSVFLDNLEEHLYGVDIDHHGIERALSAVYQTIIEISPGPVPNGFLTENIYQADFLLHDVRPGSNYKDFELIVGNPPYVQISHLRADRKADLKNLFTSAHGRMDLYVLFMERAAELVRTGGQFVFITPDKFLDSISAEPLRTLLANSGAIRSLDRFDSHKVFKNAATVPCVVAWQREAPQETFELTHCSPSLNGGVPQVVNREKLTQDRLVQGSWDVSPHWMRSLVRSIRADHEPLKNYVSRISAGIATGMQGAFVVPKADADEIEYALRRPAVRGRDLTAYELADPHLQLILPYRELSDGSMKVVQLEDYPGAHKWLLQFKKRLEERHCVRVWGKAWYDLHDPVTCDLSRVAKILVPDVARWNRFVYDPGEYVPLHSAYYLIPREERNLDARVLTAILNSPPLEFLVRSRAPKVKDGFSRYRRHFLMDLPIPEITRVHEVRIVEAYEERDDELMAHLSCSLFGVDYGDVRAALERLG